MIDILYKLSKKENLSKEDIRKTLETIASSEATEAQIGAFIMGMRLKGETVEEISEIATFFREKALKVPVKNQEELLDTCGTGGDGLSTFNISTASAFVVAGAGFKIAKHGNKSISSKCGSADILEALGVNINLSPDKIAKCIEEIGIGFIYAPLHHSVMKNIAKPRKELGIKSVFNLVGPLSNPAGAKRQIMGIYDINLVEKIAYVLKELGNVKSFVFSSFDGMDEISISSKTLIAKQTQEEVEMFEFDPEKYGFNLRNIEDITVKNIEESLNLFNMALNGIPSAALDIVLINASFGIMAFKDIEFKEALEIAKDSIFSKKAINKLNTLRECSNDIK
ncbi:anthranilate phosphoribosyltransferase [Hydrogenobaculum acidophilum]